jgi:hypothetical protein
MGNTLMTLQTFSVSPNVEIGIYTTNVLKCGKLYIALREIIGDTEHLSIYTEEEVLKLFNVYTYLKNAIDGCELFGVLIHCFSQTVQRGLYIKYVRDSQNDHTNNCLFYWELVFVTCNGEVKNTPITLKCLMLLSAAKEILLTSIVHWKNKMKSFQLMSVLGIRNGVQSLVEECRWSLFGKMPPDGLLNVRGTITMDADLTEVLCTWDKRDHFVSS